MFFATSLGSYSKIAFSHFGNPGSSFGTINSACTRFCTKDKGRKQNTKGQNVKNTDFWKVLGRSGVL